MQVLEKHFTSYNILHACIILLAILPSTYLAINMFKKEQM